MSQTIPIQKDDKPCGTYIEVTAFYRSRDMVVSNGDIIYRFMLGKDEKTDYNAERNYHYRLTLNSTERPTTMTGISIMTRNPASKFLSHTITCRTCTISRCTTPSQSSAKSPESLELKSPGRIGDLTIPKPNRLPRHPSIPIIPKRL